MADAAIEFYAPCFHGVDDGVFAYKRGTGFDGLRGGGGARRADHGNSERGVDWVREAQAVADCRAVFCGTQADGEVVFRGGGGAADFECADVAVVRGGV